MKYSSRLLLISKKTFINKPLHLCSLRLSLINPVSVKGFKQTNDLNDLIEIAQKEEKQRKAKFIEYTSKVYKPSQTLQFNREGELLLFSCDNLKNNQIYFKYPYCFYDMLFPISFYNFFVDPCKT